MLYIKHWQLGTFNLKASSRAALLTLSHSWRFQGDTLSLLEISQQHPRSQYNLNPRDFKDSECDSLESQSVRLRTLPKQPPASPRRPHQAGSFVDCVW